MGKLSYFKRGTIFLDFVFASLEHVILPKEEKGICSLELKWGIFLRIDPTEKGGKIKLIVTSHESMPIYLKIMCLLIRTASVIHKNHAGPRSTIGRAPDL